MGSTSLNEETVKVPDTTCSLDGCSTVQRNANIEGVVRFEQHADSGRAPWIDDGQG
jgi:hypothetical protein